VKYLKKRNNSLYYERYYPTSLRNVIGKGSLTVRVGSVGMAETELKRKMLDADEQYSLQCRTAVNTDVNAYAEAEIDSMALAIIEQARLRVGELHNQEFGGLNSLEAADIALNGVATIEEIQDLTRSGEALELKHKIYLRARNLLTQKRQQRRVTLNQLWLDYIQHKGLDMTQPVGKKLQKRWDVFIGITGDQLCTPDLNQDLSFALQDYADQRSGAVQSSTIERELSTIMSTLKLGSRRHTLGWHFTKPVIKKTPKNHRRPLTIPEQCQLIEFCRGDLVTKNKLKYGAVMCLLYLQCGMMPSELQRLDRKNVAFNSDGLVSHIVIDGQTKTNARKRICPIVLENAFISAHLFETMEYFKSTKDSAHSALIQRTLKTATGANDLSGHCLRHTLRAAWHVAGASLISLAMIAGWSSTGAHVSQQMLSYGAEGLSNAETLQRLRSDLAQVFGHLTQLSA